MASFLQMPQKAIDIVSSIIKETPLPTLLLILLTTALCGIAAVGMGRRDDPCSLACRYQLERVYRASEADHQEQELR